MGILRLPQKYEMAAVIKIVKVQRPDVVLMDLIMSKMDGLECIQGLSIIRKYCPDHFCITQKTMNIQYKF